MLKLYHAQLYSRAVDRNFITSFARTLLLSSWLAACNFFLPFYTHKYGKLRTKA